MARYVHRIDLRSGGSAEVAIDYTFAAQAEDERELIRWLKDRFLAYEQHAGHQDEEAP